MAKLKEDVDISAFAIISLNTMGKWSEKDVTDNNGIFKPKRGELGDMALQQKDRDPLLLENKMKINVGSDPQGSANENRLLVDSLKGLMRKGDENSDFFDQIFQIENGNTSILEEDSTYVLRTFQEALFHSKLEHAQVQTKGSYLKESWSIVRYLFGPFYQLESATNTFRYQQYDHLFLAALYTDWIVGVRKPGSR